MGERDRFTRFSPAEHPIALQLGGSDPAALAECARIAADSGFDEVNLNCGCPSDRVQTGKIGACLMAEPNLVARCVEAMKNATTLPVTVKHRIGIDDQDSELHLEQFVSTVGRAGCEVFIVHARKAWLKGLSPKQNREVPPLDYHRVFRLKSNHPEKTIVLNGGITSVAQSLDALKELDGVMMGREAYHNPYVLSEVDNQLFNANCASPTREALLKEFIDYSRSQIQNGHRLNQMSRHILGLFLGEIGARKFRRHLSENATKNNATEQVLVDAFNAMQAPAAQATATKN